MICENTNNNTIQTISRDEEALQEKLESLLVLNSVELNWLKGKRMRERSNQDKVNLEKQEHPGDAEADEGAPVKAGAPHQNELQYCNHKGRWVSKTKGLEA